MIEHTLATIVDERYFLEFLEHVDRNPIPFWPTTPEQEAHHEAMALQRGQLVMSRLIGHAIVEVLGDAMETDDGHVPMLWSGSGHVLILDDHTQITIDEPDISVIGVEDETTSLEHIIAQRIVNVTGHPWKWYDGAGGVQTRHPLVFSLENGVALEMPEPWLTISGPAVEALPTDEVARL